MTYPNCPVPPWTPAMQSLWDAAMHIERTRGAYGVGFPQEGTTFPPPGGTMFHTLLFVATSSEADVAAHLQAVRENMEGWKARVAASRGRQIVTRHEPPANIAGIDLSKVEFEL